MNVQKKTRKQRLKLLQSLKINLDSCGVNHAVKFRCLVILMVLKMRLEVQRSKVNSNKWETVKTEPYPENIRELREKREELVKYAVRREENNPNYEYRCITINDEFYRTDQGAE